MAADNMAALTKSALSLTKDSAVAARTHPCFRRYLHCLEVAAGVWGILCFGLISLRVSGACVLALPSFLSLFTQLVSTFFYNNFSSCVFASPLFPYFQISSRTRVS